MNNNHLLLVEFPENFKLMLMHDTIDHADILIGAHVGGLHENI